MAASTLAERAPLRGLLLLLVLAVVVFMTALLIGSSGIGVRQALAAADAHGLGDALMLIGDPEYYGRFFGFDAGRTAQWRVPGPVERHRLLARGNAVPAGGGMLGPVRAAA